MRLNMTRARPWENRSCEGAWLGKRGRAAHIDKFCPLLRPHVAVCVAQHEPESCKNMDKDNINVSLKWSAALRYLLSHKSSWQVASDQQISRLVSSTEKLKSSHWKLPQQHGNNYKKDVASRVRLECLSSWLRGRWRHLPTERTSPTV